MKIFADATETSFFNTDDHVKNLHEIEINSIEDFVFKHALDSDILLGIKCWMVNRFDELLPGYPSLDTSDEPELHGECIEIDFVAGMRYLDILLEIAKFEDISRSMIVYKSSGIFRSVQHEWINDDTKKWTITPFNDPRKLVVIIDSEDNITVDITNMTSEE